MRGVNGQLPAGPSLPAALQTVKWIRHPTDFLEDTAARYGAPFTLRILGKAPAVILTYPAHVREVFTGPPDVFQSASVGFRTHVGPHAVLSLDGDQHRRHRRLLQPPFQPSGVAAYGERFWEQTTKEIDRWPRGKSFKLLHAFHRITLELILQTVFGIHDEIVSKRLHRAFDRLIHSTSAVPLLVRALRWDLGRFNGWGRFLQAKREIDEIVCEGIRQTREAPEGRTDILARLVGAGDQGGEPLTDREIRDELLTILIVGHMTTTVALAWTFQWILASPKIHGVLKEEVRDRFSNGFDAAAVRKLDYLDAVVKESLRITPPILLTERWLARDATVAGWDLPAGVIVRPCQYLTHHDPEIFAEPACFDPSRFLGRQPSVYEYYPFGGGARSCLGLSYSLVQMRILVAAVLARLDLTLTAEPSRAMRRMAALLAPAHGTPVLAEPGRAA